MIMADPDPGFPDPESHPEFYAGVARKRLFAFIIDSILIVILTLIVIPFTAFTALFFLGSICLFVSVAYRTISLASISATPGMRLNGIEFRTHLGERLSFGSALAHTLLFSASISMGLPQLISVMMIVFSRRARGLNEHVMGSVVVNSSALK